MIRILALSFSIAFAAQPVLAQPAPAQDRGVLRNACSDDVAKLCPGVKPGGGRIAACFKGKRDQLSEGCRAALQQAAARR